MRAGRKAEGVDRKWMIECHALFIRDPVERLRYLRRAMGVESPAGERQRWPGCRRFAPVLLVVLLLIPIPTTSDVPWFPSLKGPPPATVDTARVERVPGVWLVERKEGFEVYSNGLRIDNRFAVDGERRAYPVYDHANLELLEWRTGPVGIVYHTTESRLEPFEPGYNRRLRRIGEWLLAFVQRNGSYHFLIDRFGRVHRVVRETDSANHAGYSVWADERWVYVNLNPSFLGVAFETQTEPELADTEVNPAQIHAAKVLTQMLRSQYDIPAANCVTHAQVSVNPWNMRIGNHTDWATGFPFGELGLNGNYGLPVPALSVFGFRYDADFVKVTGAPLLKGVALGEDRFRQQATSERVSVASHRAALKKRYRRIIEAIEEAVASKERNHEPR
jgi:hypothetical protein